MMSVSNIKSFISSLLLYLELNNNITDVVVALQKCSVNKMCRRLSVPECITLVTQRLTKYPLLFEAIIKTTKGI